uniref:Uncharacterized protein n=1 Tax=Rhizophora mucronata TaxID=61149 RepID=A0A2P2NTQ1_RHIMU
MISVRFQPKHTVLVFGGSFVSFDSFVDL